MTDSVSREATLSEQHLQLSYDPAKGFPRVAPLILYQDVNSAIPWLCRVFGFKELLRVVCEGGWIAHADLELEGGIVMLDGVGPGDYGPRAMYRKPSEDGHVCAYTFVTVSDVDAHYLRAKAEGATAEPPEDKEWGLRQYTAKDLEGHAWEFSQHIRDIPVREWEATMDFAPERDWSSLPIIPTPASKESKPGK